MLDYLNGDENNPTHSNGKKLKKHNITCLRISDSNTVGMPYDENKTDSPFYAFLRAGGVNAKSNDGAGGSFGFGKGAYYALSPIKTIIVSTKTESNDHFMEGSAILTTHKNDDGDKISAFGYYDNNNGNPSIDSERIPDVFKREKHGTDVSIIGLWPDKNRKRTMIKSVLNNFWLAIHDENLIVEIDDIIMDKANLERIMDDYFPDETENGSSNDIESWNPKPYFKAIKYAGSNENYQKFEQDLKTLGSSKLFVYLKKGLPNRTSYIRAPKMVVSRGRRNNTINGYAAVFLCENDIGNKILRGMENPAHNEWKKENYAKERGEISSVAINAEVELRKFINETLQKLSKAKIGSQTSVLGLEEYLFSSEELFEEYEERKNGGESPSVLGGVITDELSSIETGTQTTEKNMPVVVKLTNKVNSEINDHINVDLNKNGLETVSSGKKNEADGGDKIGDGNQSSSSGEKSEEGKLSKIMLNVGLRVIAQNKEGTMFHTLLINSPKDVGNAEIELFVGADNERDDGMGLTYSNIGDIKHNLISNLQLNSGMNNIKIQFTDNVKHSIKVKAYDIQ